MRYIKFTHTGHSPVFGNFSADDTARLSEHICHHFVEQAGCAIYVDVARPIEADHDAKNVTKAKKGGKS